VSITLKYLLGGPEAAFMWVIYIYAGLVILSRLPSDISLVSQVLAWLVKAVVLPIIIFPIPAFLAMRYLFKFLSTRKWKPIKLASPIAAIILPGCALVAGSSYLAESLLDSWGGEDEVSTFIAYLVAASLIWTIVTLTLSGIDPGVLSGIDPLELSESTP
jgi:hypothetical protein